MEENFGQFSFILENFITFLAVWLLLSTILFKSRDKLHNQTFWKSFSLIRLLRRLLLLYEATVRQSCKTYHLFCMNSLFDSKIFLCQRIYKSLNLDLLINKLTLRPMKPKGSTPHSQALSNHPYSEPIQSNPLHWQLFLNFDSIIVLPTTPGIS